MSRLLIHSIAFSPDGVSTAYLYNDIALRFQKEGYDVVVLTTTPQYNFVKGNEKSQKLKTRFLGLYSVSSYRGIKVYHVAQRKFKSTILRIIGFLYWHIMSLIIGLLIKGIDVILSPSPPLTLGVINILLAKLKRCKVVYNVQEIYPDLLIESGGLKSRPVIKLLSLMEKFVYRYSDKVTTIDRVFFNTIIDRFYDKNKLQIIPNFVDTDIYKPLSMKQVQLDRTYFSNSSSLKIMYAGNIGYAQDWDSLLRVAANLKDENIEFFVIGDGVMKDHLKKELVRLQLSKVHVIPYQPRKLMPSLIAYSDIQFIFMAPQTEGHGFPSKVYTIMSCGKPLLVCSGVNTPIINFLQNKGCAFLITEKDSEKKANQVVQILQSVDRQILTKMGTHGMSDIQENYSKEVVTNMYIELVDSMMTKPSTNLKEVLT